MAKIFVALMFMGGLAATACAYTAKERPSHAKISFRLNDLHWSQNLEIALDGGAGDSTWAFDPGEKACRPFIDNIYLEETEPPESAASEM